MKLLGGGLAGAAAGGALVKREDILAFLDADKAAGAAGTDLGKVTTRYYKPLGKDLSLLGFGCMRLPTTFTASGREIDKELGEKMVDFAYRHGINYFDTAWFYHDGKSEAFIGQALQKHPRDTVYLADKMPTSILTGLDQAKDIFQTQLRPEASMASWALRWGGSKEGVITMNSGMSNLEQVLDNIRTLSNFQPLSAAEERAIQRSLGKEAGSGAIPCTYCRYCEPCPYGVDIAGVFHIYNRYGEPAGIDVDHPQGASAAQEKAFLAHYQNNLERPQRASHCTACGRCLPKCPQHIDIPKHVRAIDDVVHLFSSLPGRCYPSAGAGRERKDKNRHRPLCPIPLSHRPRRHRLR